jgi:phage virion morphogenesis protein
MARNDLAELDKLLKAMSVKLRTVAQKAATTLRNRNADRIKRNVTPDGEAFEPRKRDHQGKIRKKAAMFKKLRAARRLKKKANAEGLEVGFTGNDARIARVHHEGLKDRLDRHSSKRIKYPARPLLGFSDLDEHEVIDAVMGALDL